MSNSRPVVGIRLPVWAGSTSPVLGGVADYMRRHGHWRIETLNDSYGEMEKVDIGVGWQGDGLILYRATEQELEDFKSRGIAVVLLSTEGSDYGYPRVLPDNREIGEAAAAHLLSLGIKSFAYLARGETLYRQKEHISGPRIYSRERLVGYATALSNSGYEPAVHMLPGFPLWKKESWKRIEKAVEKFLITLPKQTGLFAVDDALASVVLRVAERIGIAVPQSLSVLGFGDDVNYCHASLPTLSSIPYPARAVGYTAAKCLSYQMRFPNFNSEIIRIPLERVHHRESTDFLAIPDEETARLVRWIRITAPNLAIRIEDLLEQTTYSHSTVKMKFKQHLGHSPKKEISLTRLAHLKFLLDDPTLSLAEITSMMQFRSSHELGRFFMRETGVRPTRYRAGKKRS